MSCQCQRTSVAGVATGLAWTPAGGKILFIEASRMPGKGNTTLTGNNLGMPAMIGMVMLMGLVTKNAILLIDLTNQYVREGLSVEDAILKAGPIRLRPILMTTMAMILGMLPSAMGRGEGGELKIRYKSLEQLDEVVRRIER